MSTKIIKIGNREVEAGYFPNKEFGYEYSVEIDTFDKIGFNKGFGLRSLRNVDCHNLPSSCYISFYETRSEFKKITRVEIITENNQCHLRILLGLYYQDWDMKESLPSFVDRYCDAVKKSITHNVTLEKTDLGFFILCRFDILEVKDIYLFYSEKEVELERLYRTTLVKDSNEITPHAYGSGKIHWWIRYVFVPLAGSGAIATVLAKYLLK